MKGLRSIINKITAVILITVAVTNSTFAQDSKKDRENEKAIAIENLVNSKNFVFVAETMSPMGGRTMFLNYPYDLKITPEKVNSDLPYFGRAYVAPIDPTRGGLQFTSEDFEYKVAPAKKNGWDVLIAPKDTREVRQMSLSVSSNGNAYLQVNSNNRQAISFSGHIEEIRTKKKQ
jgi:hypothetical protein